MAQSLEGTSHATPLEIGYELLLAQQCIATELVALGLAILVVVLTGWLGVGLVKLTAMLAVPIQKTRTRGLALRRRPAAVCIPGHPHPHSHQGEDNGI